MDFKYIDKKAFFHWQLNHVLFFDGDGEKISWVIKTSNSTIKQSREHVEMYKNKVNNLQSKYIALHVGLFWAIGTFVIKKEDHVKIICNEKRIQEHLSAKKENEDNIIEKRKKFINQIIIQRKLKVIYKIHNDVE